MLDPRIFATKIEIRNHDCEDPESLVYEGNTAGTRVYQQILHGGRPEDPDRLGREPFTAGASGGRSRPVLTGGKRKYLCFPQRSCLKLPVTRDLVLDGNPATKRHWKCEESRVDYIINVTLDQEFNSPGSLPGTGSRTGKPEHLKSYVAIPLQKEYDIVVTMPVSSVLTTTRQPRSGSSQSPL